MKLVYTPAKAATTDQVQAEIARLVAQLGDAAVVRLLPLVIIGTVETPVAHGLGSVPKGWALYSPQGHATVRQVRPPDEKRLFLEASAELVTGIEVF